MAVFAPLSRSSCYTFSEMHNSFINYWNVSLYYMLCLTKPYFIRLMQIVELEQNIHQKIHWNIFYAFVLHRVIQNWAQLDIIMTLECNFSEWGTSFTKLFKSGEATGGMTYLGIKPYRPYTKCSHQPGGILQLCWQ